MRVVARLAASLVLLALVGGGRNASAQQMISVDIIDAPRPLERWGYAPRTQRVTPGTWVTWSNAGQDAHSVTAVDGSFDSFELQPSEGFSWYFEQAGTFDYLCTLHDWMVGRVVVEGEVLEEPTMEAPAEDPQ
jgi:plastocyanin